MQKGKNIPFEISGGVRQGSLFGMGLSQNLGASTRYRSIYVIVRTVMLENRYFVAALYS